MNSDTGKSYTGPQVPAAMARGEKLVEISFRAATEIRRGRHFLAQQQRERRRRKQARRRDAMAKASRRGNRRG